ncbi:MAG: hypothetical protein ACRELV_01845, partial [Longimicrobiales bacterium]
ILYLAEQSPLLTLSAPRLTSLENGDVRIDVTVANEGFLPTHLTVRGRVGRETDDGRLVDLVVRPPEVRLELDRARLVDGETRTVLPHLAGSETFTGLVTERATTVSWVVRPERGVASVRVIAHSDTGGTRRSDVVPLR